MADGDNGHDVKKRNDIGGAGGDTWRETDGVMAVYSPLPESNATGCLQIMQMKCKSEEQCSEGNGFHIDVVMEMPHTSTCVHVRAWGHEPQLDGLAKQ